MYDIMYVHYLDILVSSYKLLIIWLTKLHMITHIGKCINETVKCFLIL